MSTPPPPPPRRPGPDDSHQPGQQPPPGTPMSAPRNSVTLPAPVAALPATVWQWVGGFVAAFVGVTIAVALLSVALLAMSDVGGDSDSSLDAPGVVRTAIFFAVSAWTGHFGFGFADEDYSGGGGFTVPVSGVAVLGLVALGAAAMWLTRTFRPVSRGAVWGQIAAAVTTCLVIVSVLGLIGRFTDEEMSVSPLGFGAMVRLGVALTIAAVVGVACAAPRGERTRRLFGDTVEGVAQRVKPSIDAALLHLGAWTVIGLVGGVFAAIVIRDDLPFGMSLMYLTTAIPTAMSWAHLGGIGLSVDGSQDVVDFLPDELARDMSWTIFSESSPWVLWLLPLLAAAVVALIATRLTLLRAPGSSVDARHIAATACSLVLLWFVVVRVIGSMTVSFDSQAFEEEFGGSFTAGAAWWTYIMLFLTGVGIELVHVFAGSLLVQRLPRGLVQRLVPRPHPGWGPYLGGAAPTPAAPAAPQSSSAAGTGGPGAGQGVSAADPGDQPTVVAQAQDQTPPRGTPPADPGTAWGSAQDISAAWGQPQPVSGRAKVAIGAVVGVLCVIAIGWFVVDQVGKRYFGPEGVALDYASAVVDGRASDAVEAGQVNVADRHRLLLTDDVYQSVEGRPEAAEVTDVEESDDGESATVTLEFEQGGQRFTQTVEADREGREKLFFPKWELQPVELPSASLTVAADTVEVGDQTVDLAEHAEPDDERLAPLGTDDEGQPPSYRVNLPALPGKYSFGLPSTKFLEADPVEVSIAADQTGGEDDGNYSEEGETLVAEPGEALSEELDAQIKKKIDGCVSNYDENACPWDTSFDDTADYSKRSFTVEEYPDASVSSTDTVREGEEFALDLGGSVTIEEEATCRADVSFGCRRGDTRDTTQYLSSSGWSAVIKGDSVTVEWSDDTDWDY